jgi:hypothetical protein
VDIASRSSYISSVLHQQWEGNIETDFSIPFSITAAMDLDQASTGYPMDTSSYFKNWIFGYRILIPWAEDPTPARGFSSSCVFALETKPAGFSLQPRVGFSNSGTEDRSQKNTGSFRIIVPFSFASDTPFSWSVTPAYTRRFSVTAPAEPGASFADDFNLFGYQFSKQQFIYSTFPVDDLFSDDLFTRFIETTKTVSGALYSSTLSLDLSRISGSYLRDLFIPSQGRILLQRTIEKNESLITDTFSWTASLKNTAINLFGALGVTPIFTWYESEEIHTFIKMDVDFENSTSPTNTTLIVQNLLEFSGQEKHGFSLDNRFSYTWATEDSFSEDLLLEFNWQVFPDYSITLPVFESKQERPPYFLHTESLDFSIGKNESEADTMSYKAIVKHQTALVFPDLGKILGHISLGISSTSAGFILFGIQAGVEGTIRL